MNRLAQFFRVSLPPPFEGEGRGGGYRAAGFVEKMHPPPHAARSIFVKYENRVALSSPSRGEEEGNT